jgi:hypothetical protein
MFLPLLYLSVLCIYFIIYPFYFSFYSGIVLDNRSALDFETTNKRKRK